jgi:hypothetical protein
MSRWDFWISKKFGGIQKMHKGKWIQITGLLLACCGLQGLATAGIISSTGTFKSDDQVFELDFTLSSAGTVTIQSFGYGGGTNGAGMLIPQGGFATDVAVFSASGAKLLIDQDAFGGNPDCGPRGVNSDTGFCLDGYLSLSSLAAGDYILTLTQQGNPANGPIFADGFAQDGGGNFTGGPFLDPFGNQMNGNWAVDVSSASLVVDSTTAPEPATVLLTVILVPGLAVAARRRRRC